MADISTPLNDWTLRAAPVNTQQEQALDIPRAACTKIPAPGGGLIHQSLIRADIIKDPLIGENCFECEWTENCDWVYETSFDRPSEPDEKTRIELRFESLDGIATVRLNGETVARHRNSYRPLVVDVTDKLLPSRNQLEVHLSQGLDQIGIEESTAPDGVQFATEESLGYRDHRGEPRRIFLRKPAFGFGWDWNPRVATLGLAGSVQLVTSRAARIESLSGSTLSLSPEGASVKACVELNGLHYYSSTDARLTVELIGPDGTEVARKSRPLLVCSGFSEVDVHFFISNPRLWWPRGSGKQYLHTLRARLEDASGQTLSLVERQMGIRTLRLLSAETFAFEINGKKIFCQGGNWVPPDVIYTRADAERYRSILCSAADANMNMLRVWGGGRYEPDYFYETCDRLGLLVWQDFMFACSPYPDHLDWFRQEVAEEARYQVRRLSGHACLALWCGSNENTWAMCDWWGGKTRRGAHLYNDILPRAVRANAPHVPYWVGSPYGGETPNQYGVGNNHFWKEPGGTLCPDPTLRTDLTGHDRSGSFFISEYGYHGPCSLAETRRYLGTKDFDRRSRSWIHHTNTRSYENTLRMAVEQLYGIDLAAASNQDYLLYGSLWQGVAYAYSLDAARFRPECSGAIIWMLNEAWGEAGWGIIDHSLARKTAWYFVRRALAPLRLILRRDADTGRVDLMLHNQPGTPTDYAVELRANFPDGRILTLAQANGRAKRERQIVLSLEEAIPADAFVSAHGKAGEQALDSVLLWPGSFTALLDGDDAQPRLAIHPADNFEDSQTLALTLEADRFVHGVHFMLGEHVLPASDQYLDLFAGEARTVKLACPAKDAARLRIGWVGSHCRPENHCLNKLHTINVI
ncbi:glycoside hydrolase family 2 protein [Ruficoccus amylovorans]|uniref:beta-mannosidase n=1 Tax=Ruficoccus amylovorans TaxID=1804625 RepID=A0A842HBU1_9BACT|nr:glycoside hydrolase family 2 protein [Ruficoccus amylovorans]MBC2593882.1 glycoside hydrolase family 2 protein [Ruficoccus amylovorans]